MGTFGCFFSFTQFCPFNVLNIPLPSSTSLLIIIPVQDHHHLSLRSVIYVWLLSPPLALSQKIHLSPSYQTHLFRTCVNFLLKPFNGSSSQTLTKTQKAPCHLAHKTLQDQVHAFLSHHFSLLLMHKVWRQTALGWHAVADLWGMAHPSNVWNVFHFSFDRAGKYHPLGFS